MRFPILLLSLLVFACNTRPARVEVPLNKVPGRLDFDAFTLKAPPDWKTLTAQTSDSYEGGLTDGTDTLTVLYGEYSRRIDDFGDPGRLFSGDTIDGFPTVVSIPGNKKQGLVEMDVELPSPRILYIAGSVRNVQIALAIFQSVHFNSGDPTRMGRFTLDRFVSNQPPTGGSMFRFYCGICHEQGRAHLTRPLNSYYVREKGEKWIVDFMMHADKKAGEPGHESCPERTKLTLQQIQEIVRYVEN